MDINELKKSEISEIYDFLETLQEYGHIYHLEPKKLDKPFKKILEGMNEIINLMNESWDI